MNIFQKFIAKLLPKNIDMAVMKAHIVYTKISFDASIMPNGNLGIGMFDITNNVKKNFGGNVGSHSSAKGERVALEFVLKYAHDVGIKNMVLFTDNIDLARKGITKNQLKDYSFGEIHLTWVPRELNQDADKQSKHGQKLNKGGNFSGAAANTVNTSKTIALPSTSCLTKLKKVIPLSENDIGTMRIFAKYSMKQKIKMLENLADYEQHHEVEFY